MTTLEADPLPLDRDPSGVIRVGGTRVSFDSVIAAYRGGSSMQELAGAFPDLSLPDIHATIAYYLKHRGEMDEYLEARRRKARAVEARLRRDFPEAYRRVERGSGRERDATET